jgi:competence protein ComEC
MRRPLLPVALLLILGILLGEYAQPSLAALFGAGFAAAGAALVWERGRPWLLGLLLVLTGWTDACRHSAIFSGNDLRVVAGGEARLVALRGRIMAPPSQRIYERDRRETWHTSALIEAEEMESDGVRQAVTGRVVAGTPGVLPEEVFEGQEVEVSGVLEAPHGPVAQGMFNPRAFYSREGVYYQLQTSGPDAWKAEKGAWPVSERFRQWARRTLALGLPEEDEALRLTWTLLLDWKAPLTGGVEEPFLRAGTFHIFAVDGLRIGLLAGIGLGLFRLLQLPRAACGALVVPALWFYAGLTGWPASAVRATVMASILFLGWVCRRPMDLLNSLFAAAVLILLWDPGQLFEPGFQLSFMVVLCIAVIYPAVRLKLQGWLFGGDPFLPEALKPQWPPFVRSSVSHAVDVFAMSVAAWVGSIPLAALYFHLFTPVSIPANCLVVPATALALTSAMGSLLAGAWFPGLAGLFNNATWALMKFIIAFSRSTAQWPGGNWNVAAPSTAACLIYYAALLAVCTGWVFHRRRIWVAGAALLAAGLALAATWAAGARTARLHLLPLNGAPVIYAEGAGRDGNLLIDCGNERMAGDVVKPFLCAQGVNRLGGVCLAVGRLDYFGGARLLLSNFTAGPVFTGTARSRSPGFRRLTNELSQSHLWRVMKDPGRIEGWSVLHPGAGDSFAQADDNAVALWREFDGHAVLALPALGRDGQDALMGRHPDLRAEVVIAGLPARDEPLCEPLLDMLRARLIVIADAKYPATRRAPVKLRERLARRGARVVYCRDNGALTLELTPGGWTVVNSEGKRAVDADQTSDPDLR